MGVVQEIQFAMDQAAIEQLIADSSKAGERIGAKLTEAIGAGGKDKAREVATEMMGDLSRELERNEARVKEALARGLISPEAASRAADANSRAYNAGVLKAMDQLRAKGALTNEAFVEMTKNLKNVGAASSEVDKTTTSVSRLSGLVTRAAGLLGGLFALHRIKLFGEQAIEEFKKDEAALDRLDSALRRMGTSAEELAPQLRQTEGAMRALRLDEDETQEILGTLIGRTNQVRESFNNVGLVVAFARREHLQFAEASQIVANLMNGNVMRIRQFGINATNAKDALAELRRETAGEGEKWAATLEGRLTGLNVLWGNFKSAIGEAMIEAGGGSSVIDTLSATIQAMTTWVSENHDAIRELKDAIFEVVGTIGEFIRSLKEFETPGASFRKDLAEMEHSLNVTNAAVTIFSGNVKEQWGNLLQLLTFGALGEKIAEDGRKIMAEGDRMMDEADSRWRAKLNRITSTDRGKVTPGEGESLGTIRSGIVPIGPGGGGGKDALREAAEAKRIAAEAKRAADELRKAHDETIQNAIKLVEAEATRGEALFLLRGEENALKDAIKSGNLSIHDRTEALVKLGEVQEAIKKGRPALDEGQMGKDINKALGITPPDKVIGEATMDAATAEAVRRTAEGGMAGIPSTLPSVQTTFDSILGDMRENSADVAESIADNFSDAFDRMKQDGFTVNSILSNLGKGMAKSILGEIAKVAKGEAMQALANAIKFTAIGIGQLATGNPLASKSFAAAATHAKSAVAWGLLAGSVGSIGGGGGGEGGGGAGSASVERTSTADSMKGPQSITNIFFDPFDPRNPRHQELVGETQRRYNETTGGNQVVFHPGGYS